MTIDLLSWRLCRNGKGNWQFVVFSRFDTASFGFLKSLFGEKTIRIPFLYSKSIRIFAEIIGIGMGAACPAGFFILC